MAKCYLCGKELTAENESEEHIILNALGGRYKSKKLLCKKCNNNSGTEYDAALADQYHFITGMLGLTLEKGKVPDIRMKGDDGNEYIIKDGTTPELDHPIVNKGKIDGTAYIFSITANNKDEIETILKNLKNKGFKIDIDDALTKAKVKREPSPMMRTNLTFGGIKSFPAVLKIAVSQYIEKTEDIDSVRDAIEDIKKPSKDLSNFKRVELCILEKDIFSIATDEVSHSVLLNANAAKHKLYAIIQLFNLQQYIVKLSDSYNGNDFTDLYVYDVLKKESLKKECLYVPDSDFIFNYEYPKANPNFSIMKDRFERIMNIAARRIN